MYKSNLTLLYRRVSLALILLVAACGGSDSGNAHEEALENGTQTQHLEDDQITGDSVRNSHYNEAPTYNSEDTAMANRKIQQ